jgi:hypothetical protein
LARSGHPRAVCGRTAQRTGPTARSNLLQQQSGRCSPHGADQRQQPCETHQRIMLLPSSIMWGWRSPSSERVRMRLFIGAEHRLGQPPPLRDAEPPPPRPRPHGSEFLHVKAAHRAGSSPGDHGFGFPQHRTRPRRIPPEQLAQPSGVSGPQFDLELHPVQPEADGRDPVSPAAVQVVHALDGHPLTHDPPRSPLKPPLPSGSGTRGRSRSPAPKTGVGKMYRTTVAGRAAMKKDGVESIEAL